ncbi:hypothetical protein IMG5_120040 [Ichthyophthirius multifiliis]|uniref:Uncharacterized protein n=1 Tax=Ichthyophthirius multifiliis TaxID=5932 RepID=G0QUY3_ICHMU|nr:hypothetical protein IMG5_120040 [Ichthyophthirius multifiliis]EGR30988.1 hypothetical protein IMG5_120040 [Ichthyophthirius multifiliis]|eukprot:XP_004034474.1 hypothetical protein IMG5_120040 [Ichthyophthirius multifiliis]
MDNLTIQNNACIKIQKLWRSYTNRKIYKYYNNIILFKCKGNPARLLKAINPLEAQLLETASNVHLRFRLGGETFPPNIYYKIYTHGALCDINSYAPRDYSVIQRDQNDQNRKIKYKQYIQNKDNYQSQGWYLRIDNNGWRPISHKVFIKTDYVELFSANKIKYYHFKKEKRNEKIQKKQRLNKLRWIQNMYKNARIEEEQELEQKKQNNQNQNQNQEEDEENLNIPKDFNPLKDQRYIDLNEDQFNNEVKDLIEWSKNLDFDEYIKDWFQLSTSNASEAFVVRPIKNNLVFSSIEGHENSIIKDKNITNKIDFVMTQYIDK